MRPFARLIAIVITAALLFAASPAAATVLVTSFTSCMDSYTPIAPANQLLNVTNVYAVLVPKTETLRQNYSVGAGNDVLRYNLVGKTGAEMVGLSSYSVNATTNGTKLSTLFTTTTAAGIKEWSTADWVCNKIYSANPGAVSNYTSGSQCPLPPGDFAIAIQVPLYNFHSLTTIHTQVRVVDSQQVANSLACVDVLVTPYNPTDWPYRLFLWLPAAIVIGYFIVTWSARLAAGWVIGADRTDTRQATLLKWGTMIISGLSGERLAVSAALLRYVTPGFRDIVHHLQFVTMLGMIAANWPAFFYPIVTQSAWADLTWNVSIVSDKHVTIFPSNYTRPSNFSDQFDNVTSPLYLNNSSPNPIIDLNTTASGLASFAKVLGMRRQDLFGTCLSLFMMIVAILVFLQLMLWLTHWLAELMGSEPDRVTRGGQGRPTHTNRNSYASTLNTLSHSRNNSNTKEWFEARGSSDLPSGSGPRRNASPQVQSKFRRISKRFTPRGPAGAFHFAALYGNLLRLILLFHFPVTALSTYQLALGEASTVSKVFAGLSLGIISVIIPAIIMYKVSRTSTGKLYDAPRTLLSLGTVYNVYEQEKQLYRTLPLLGSLVSGIVIGAGQRSGLAQAVVLVTVELVTFVATTVWSPWGQGASMGGTVVVLSMVRICSIVLAMILSPAIGLDELPQMWLTYIILITQALVFIFFLLMLLTKITEGLIRLLGGATFDESTHPIDGGIFAAIMDLDCFNGVRGGKATARKRRKRESAQLQRNVSVAGSLTTQMMLDRHSQGVERQLVGYPMTDQEALRRGSYFPVDNPSIEFISTNRRSTSDAGSVASVSEENRILDNWRPIAGYEAAPLSSPTESMNTRRHSAPWVNSGYPSRRPLNDDTGYNHNRSRSSSATLLASPQSPMSPVMSSTIFPPARSSSAQHYNNRDNLHPVPLNMARPVPLNSDDGPEDDVPARSKRGKRRSGGWFGRGQEPPPRNPDDSSSDDEPAPSSRRARRGRSDQFSEETPPQQGRGWRGLFKKKTVVDDETRDRKSAQQAARMNESAMILTGVEPVGGSAFKVQRKQRPGQTASVDSHASTAQPPSVSSVPLLPAAPASAGSSGFRVQRPQSRGSVGGTRPVSFRSMGSPQRTPPSLPSPPIQEADIESRAEPLRPGGFRVFRQTGGRPLASPGSVPEEPEPVENVRDALPRIQTVSRSSWGYQGREVTGRNTPGSEHDRVQSAPLQRLPLSPSSSSHHGHIMDQPLNGEGSSQQPDYGGYASSMFQPLK